jgi:hypothetical protein
VTGGQAYWSCSHCAVLHCTSNTQRPLDDNDDVSRCTRRAKSLRPSRLQHSPPLRWLQWILLLLLPLILLLLLAPQEVHQHWV